MTGRPPRSRTHPVGSRQPVDDPRVSVKLPAVFPDSRCLSTEGPAYGRCGATRGGKEQRGARRLSRRQTPRPKPP